MSMNPKTRPFVRASRLWLPALALLLGGVLLPACSAQEAGGQGGGDTGAKVLAKVNDQEITEADAQDNAKDQLEQAEAQLVQCQANYERSKYQIMEASVRGMVEDRLLEAEAAERGITKEELIQAEVDGTLSEVTDEQVDAWYEENKARIRGTKEQLAPQIKQFLEQQQRQTAHDDFISSLKKGAEVAYYLAPPRTEVASEGFPAKGPEAAPVTIVEFSDFECPFCARVNPTLAQVQETYGDKVRIVFRQFPLNIHPNAPKAAEAALCAHDQGKFWEMHDLLFAEQRQLSVTELKAKAERLELDAGAFGQCLDSGKHTEQVQADLQDGQRAGVSGTPALFINGRLLSGAQPFEKFAEMIDFELELAGGE